MRMALGVLPGEISPETEPEDSPVPTAVQLVFLAGLVLQEQLLAWTKLEVEFEREILVLLPLLVLLQLLLLLLTLCLQLLAWAELVAKRVWPVCDQHVRSVAPDVEIGNSPPPQQCLPTTPAPQESLLLHPLPPPDHAEGFDIPHPGNCWHAALQLHRQSSAPVEPIFAKRRRGYLGLMDPRGLPSDHARLSAADPTHCERALCVHRASHLRP
mmetsp:Transcript_81659/g.162084  ORF Transcript_81659/g.162084 Transcript_81659/m.162084 type:complete len:213 (-) Transcript_81659:1513-2151(-)